MPTSSDNAPANVAAHSLNADLVGGQRAVVAPVQHLVALCYRQHKRTYVPKRLMWRSPRDGRRDGAFGTDKRHVTWSG